MVIGSITSILSVLVCPWLFVSSPQAMTDFVGIFGAAPGPMYGILVADYDLNKTQQVAVGDLYTMAPAGTLYFEGGWDRRALYAPAVSGVLSMGLALLGAFGVIFNVGDWGCLVGAAAGALRTWGFAQQSQGAPALKVGSYPQ